MTRARAVSILSAPDYQLMRRVNRWRAPRWVRWWSIGATRAGDGWLWSLCGVALLAWDADRYAAIVAGYWRRHGHCRVPRLKKAVGRKRPCMIEPIAGQHCCCRISFISFRASITAFAVAVSWDISIRPCLPACFLRSA